MSSFRVRFPSTFGASPTHWRWTGNAELTIHAEQTHIEGRRRRPFWFAAPQSVTFDHQRVRDVLQVGDRVSCRVHLEGRTPEPLQLRAESEQQAREIAALWPDTQSREFVEHREFEAQLTDGGTRVRVTHVLVGACVLMFLLPVLGGISILEPNGADMIRWGTNFGPLTLSGQSWRLFSAMFLHFGLIHLLLNMWALMSLGPLVERLLGGVRFATLYVLAGLGGSIASIAWNPDVNSAGASGAIFGVMGALLALMLNPRTRIPPSVAVAQRNSAMLFIAYNVFNGLTHQGIDNAAHAGGLATGFALGWLMAVPVGTRPARLLERSLLLPAVAAIAVLGGALAWLQHPGTEEAERRQLATGLQPFFDAERQAAEVMRKVSEDIKAGKVSHEAAAARIQGEVKPLWEGATRTLAGATAHVTGARLDAATAIRQYVEARLQLADLTADALLHEDEDRNAKAADAAAVVTRLAKDARAALDVLKL